MRTALPCLLLLLTACDDPPTPGEVRTHLATDLQRIADATVAASDVASSSQLTALAQLAFANPKATFDDTIAWLEDELFTDANYLGDGLFRVPGATDDRRVQVTRSGAGLQFTLQLDADHDEPLAIDLQHDSLGISLDLDVATRAMTSPVRLSGAVSSSLQVLGDAHVHASFSIDRAIQVSLGDGDDALRISSAKATALAIDLDGGTRRGEIDGNFGPTAIHTPSGFDLDVPAATWEALIAGSGRLSVTNIGLGDRPLTVTRHGALGFSLDINPDDGRRFAASIARAGDTETVFAVAPKLDARIAIDHAVLGEVMPLYDVTRFVLIGALQVGAERGRVIAGSVALTTNPIPYGFVATTDQCITVHDGVYTVVGSCP